MPDPTLSRLALGITLFRPNRDQVDRVLAHAASGFSGVIAFDDGGLPDGEAERLARAGVTLLSAGRNVGIAEALNRIAEAARAAGAKTLLLLDQDAEPPAGLAAALLAALARLREAAIPVAVVGPAPAPAAGHKAPSYPPRPGMPGCGGISQACGALPPACGGISQACGGTSQACGALAPVQFLATSGSLIDLDALARIGPFRADFFIDGVELEWCFRAWSLGLGCYLARDVAIPHRVGGGVIRGLGIAMPRQPLFRMATYLRNAIYAWRLPHVPLRWKLAQVAYLPLQAGLYWADSGWRPAVLLRLLAAVRDGALGRLGPPRDRA